MSTTPKIPPRSVGEHDLYLKSAVEHWLAKADAERDSKERERILRYVADLVRPLRVQRGRVIWAPVGFALGMCLVLVWLAHRQSTRDFTFSAPADTFQILNRYDAYHYQFRHLHNGIPVKTLPVTFCQNYEPQLSAGQTLIWLHYSDLGRCWDIQPEGYGYSFETTDGLHPTLAPNCFVEQDMTVCSPNPTEARF